MNAGSDFAVSTTPYEVGLGDLVEFDDSNFVGKSALVNADRSCSWGMPVPDGVAQLGRVISLVGWRFGLISSSGFSPDQGFDVCIFLICSAAHRPGKQIKVDCIDGRLFGSTLVLCRFITQIVWLQGAKWWISQPAQAHSGYAMYDLKLNHSNFPVQNDDQIEAVKVGGILRQIAARHGRAVAMVDVDEIGRCGNQWTYIAMLDDAE